jgi:hypothetical protein
MKVVVALIAVAALTLAVVGLAAAQIAQNQTTYATGPNAPVQPANGFWGWIGNCFGFRGSQTHYGEQFTAPPVVSNSTGPAPAPYQGDYEYGYGYGPCWAR